MTRILLNGDPTEIPYSDVRGLQSSLQPGMLVVVNGRSSDCDTPLRDGDSVTTVANGVFDQDVAKTLLAQRYSADVLEKIRDAKIGIAGLGGIGSHIAESLVRAGFRNLVVADMDSVDMTNLNRQNYYLEDIGRPKTVCTVERLYRINPGLDVEAHDVRVTHENACDIFRGCDIVCEAFDDAESKAMLVESILFGLEDTCVVSSSGMAGFSTTNTMHAGRRMSRLYVCGDNESDSSEGAGLTSTRVMACAGMAAHLVMRIILGLEH